MSDSRIYINPDCLDSLRYQCEYAMNVAIRVRDEMSGYMDSIISALENKGLSDLKTTLDDAKYAASQHKKLMDDAKRDLNWAKDKLNSERNCLSSMHDCPRECYADARRDVANARDEVNRAREYYQRVKAEYQEAQQKANEAKANYERGTAIVSECKMLRDKWNVQSTMPPWGGNEVLKMLVDKMNEVPGKLSEIANITNEYVSVRISGSSASSVSYSSFNQQPHHEDLEQRKVISQEIKKEQVERANWEKIAKPGFISKCPVCKRPLGLCCCQKAKLR